MATVKLHEFSGEDNGQVSCDYRGQGELHGQHKTLEEQEFGPDVTTNERIEQVIADGPAWNRLTAQMLEGLVPAGPLGGLIAQITKGAGLRIGVFDH